MKLCYREVFNSPAGEVVLIDFINKTLNTGLPPGSSGSDIDQHYGKIQFVRQIINISKGE